ncbi:hypothetical protein [Moorena sp. SIO4G3]|uniref:hypothetical protein n=1 Tax=Moorena sp. SIO4G3 TaxID=2607821 RepID=UPI00142B15C2|nr:hypothetical protein [Moorena sp. SIO4G3]NEO77057.1 hypothetical protein [Moorena sp. SIO4G3]
MSKKLIKSLVITTITAWAIAASAIGAGAQLATSDQEFMFFGTVEGVGSFVNVEIGSLEISANRLTSTVEQPARSNLIFNSNVTVSIGELIPLNERSRKLLEQAIQVEYGILGRPMSGSPDSEIIEILSKNGQVVDNRDQSTVETNESVNYDLVASLSIESLTPLVAGEYLYKFKITISPN